MGGIDRFIAKQLTRQIKKELTQKDRTKLEHALFLEEGMSIKLAIEHFEILHNKMKHVLNKDPTTIEKKCVEKLLKFKQLKNLIVLNIKNEDIIQNIIEKFGDKEIRQIMLLVMNESKTIPELLSLIKIPKTSAYRKIENLILNGFLIETGRVRSQSKRISKYRLIFDQIIIRTNRDTIDVECAIDKDRINESEVIKKIFNF